MKFTTKPTQPKVAVVDTLELIEAQESIQQAWQDLDESVKQLDAVQSVMDNINTAVRAIEQFGSEAVPVLNIDQGLESLLDMPAKLITADKALEGLGEAAKAAWEKLKEWVKKIADAIKKFIARWKARSQIKVNAARVGAAIAAARKSYGANFNSEFQEARCWSYTKGRKPDLHGVEMWWPKWRSAFDNAVRACQSIPTTSDVVKVDQCLDALRQSTNLILQDAFGYDPVFARPTEHETFREAGFNTPEDALAFVKKNILFVTSIIDTNAECSDQIVKLTNALSSTTKEPSAEIRRAIAALNAVMKDMIRVVVGLSNHINAAGVNLQSFVWNRLTPDDRMKFADMRSKEQ